MITQNLKSGLSYFPLPIVFLFNRALRRIMKKEGDASLAIILNAITMIYSEEGYFVKVNELFYEDISANLFDQDMEEVVRVIELAVKFDMFDKRMFEEHDILTSADIQRQFLFCTRRRVDSTIDARYSLLDESEMTDVAKVKDANSRRNNRRKQNSVLEESGLAVTNKPMTVTDLPMTVTEKAMTVTDLQQIKENQIKENQTKENIPPHTPPRGRVEGFEDDIFLNQPIDIPTEEEFMRGTPSSTTLEIPGRSSTSKRKVWTPEDIEQLVAPNDGVARNLDLLRENLALFRVVPAEQYAIICKSNYGAIGHAVWSAFGDLRNGRSKIKFPGKFLLSKMV